MKYFMKKLKVLITLNIIKFLKNVDKNRIKYINDNMENIRNLFNDLSILKNKRFEFKQPMRINLLSLMKGYYVSIF